MSSVTNGRVRLPAGPTLMLVPVMLWLIGAALTWFMLTGWGVVEGETAIWVSLLVQAALTIFELRQVRRVWGWFPTLVFGTDVALNFLGIVEALFIDLDYRSPLWLFGDLLAFAQEGWGWLLLIAALVAAVAIATIPERAFDLN